jgi:hypothetical protein
MSNRPEPPPWGALITGALGRARLSVRAAAQQAGISEGRWRQIAGGYQVVSSGVYAPVRGPAGTLARMAAVAGVTPAELAAAGRSDAADALAASAPSGEVSDADDVLKRIRAMSQDQARELLATIALQLGVRLPGERADERRYGT